MKLALAGLFLMLGTFAWFAAEQTGDHWFALGAFGFWVASIASSVSVLKGYKGTKRQ
jgi:hypothetical protein